MSIRALGYVGIAAKTPQDWSEFATSFLGMQQIDAGGGTLALRMDDRRQRLIVEQADYDGTRFFGWETADAAGLAAVAVRVETSGVAVKREPQALADQRHVRELISFTDPAGNRVEVFHGAAIAADPFCPGRAISGFRTGPLGLGHAVLFVRKPDEVKTFYRDVLGFGLSEYMIEPFRATFFHVNGRHHSFAIVDSDRDGMHHLMVEMCALDDVGHAYDIALGIKDRVGVTLGRHANDYMLSFYSRSPSGFLVECGWGGREIDPANWTPYELGVGPSIWGHDREWLPPPARAAARQMLLDNAAQGLRHPVQVVDGNYTVMPGRVPG